MPIMEVVMSQLRELAEKAIEALREAQAAGVVQIKGRLGDPDGCRCAEGVIADLLVAEGILNTSLEEDDQTMWWWNAARPDLESPMSLSGVLSEDLQDLVFIPIRPDAPNLKCALSTLNDRHELTFGQIADVMEKALEEGFYGE